MRWFRLLHFTAALLLLGGVAVQAADETAAKAGARVPQPFIEPARGGQCLEDPALMRRKHAEFLRKQADDTVHGGVRGAKHSLRSCIDCHASQSSQSVAAKDYNFCIGCHSFVAVKINCFTCHSAQPGKNTDAFHPPVRPGGSTSLLSWQVHQLTSPPDAQP